MKVCWIGWSKIHFWDKVVGHWRPKEGFQIDTSIPFSPERIFRRHLVCCNLKTVHRVKRNRNITTSYRSISSIFVHIHGEIFEKFSFLAHYCIICLLSELGLNFAVFDWFNVDFRDSRTFSNDLENRLPHLKLVGNDIIEFYEISNGIYVELNYQDRIFIFITKNHRICVMEFSNFPLNSLRFSNEYKNSILIVQFCINTMRCFVKFNNFINLTEVYF